MIADFRIARKVKESKVLVMDIPKLNHVLFSVDGQDVEAIKKIIKPNNGDTGSKDLIRVEIICHCKECSMIGWKYPSTTCRRRWAVLNYILQHDGRITQDDVYQ